MKTSSILAHCFILSTLAITANAQWTIVRQRIQEDGIHSYTSISSFDGNTIYICGGVAGTIDDYVIEKSTDGGLSWSRQYTGSFPQFDVAISDKLHDIATHDGVNAVVVADSGLVAATHDGGITWTVRSFGKRFKLFDVDINSNGNVAVTGNYGTVGISRDTGRTWQFKELIDSTTFIDCKIFGSDTIYLVDRYYANFFRSFDGGATWDSVKIYPKYFDGNSGAQFYDAFFWNSREGLVVGLNKTANSGYQIYNNIITRTSDAGATWTVIMDTLMPYTNGLQRIDFHNEHIGIIGTRGRDILLSSDRGVTWQQDSIIIPEEVVRASYAVLAGDNKYIVSAKTELGNGEIALYNPNSEVTQQDEGGGLGIYILPNPATSQISISFGTDLPTSVTIHDALGREVFHSTAYTKSVEYDCRVLPPGVYFVKATSNAGITESCKFIKN